MKKKMSVVELFNSFPLSIDEVDNFGDRLSMSLSSDDAERVCDAFGSLVSDFAAAVARTWSSEPLELALAVDEFRELFFSLSIPERKFVAWFVNVMDTNGADYALRAVECFSWVSYVGYWTSVAVLLKSVSIEKMYRDCERVSEIVRDMEVAAV